MRKQHVVSRPRRSSGAAMSPAARSRQSVSSRPRDSASSPPPPAAAAATVALAEAPPPPPPPPPPPSLVSPRARGSPSASAQRRGWPATPAMPPKTPEEGRALRANLDQVLSDHNSRRSSTFAAGKPAAVPVAAEEQK